MVARGRARLARLPPSPRRPRAAPGNSRRRLPPDVRGALALRRSGPAGDRAEARVQLGAGAGAPVPRPARAGALDGGEQLAGVPPALLAEEVGRRGAAPHELDVDVPPVDEDVAEPPSVAVARVEPFIPGNAGKRAALCPGTQCLRMKSRTYSPNLKSARVGESSRAAEPISVSDTCATEARWDAVLGGSRRRIDSMLGATDNEMRPDRPVPSGAAARTVGCIVALLDHIDI